MSSYLSEHQMRSMKTLSIQRPRPSIEMPPRRIARPRLRPERLDPHQPHQSPHALALDRKTLLRQRPCDAPGAEERPRGEQHVDAPHRLKVVVVGRSRFAIDSRARHAEQRALSAYG